MAPPALLRQVLTLLTYRSLLHQSARLYRIHRTDPVLQDLRLLERGQTAARRGAEPPAALSRSVPGRGLGGARRNLHGGAQFPALAHTTCGANPKPRGFFRHRGCARAANGEGRSEGRQAARCGAQRMAVQRATRHGLGKRYPI